MSEVGASEPQVVRVGEHEVCAEEPDFMFYRLRGAVVAEEVRRIMAAEVANWPGRDRMYVLVAMHGVSLMPGVILAAVDVYRGAPKRIIAIVGASFSTRVAVDMMVRSLRLAGVRTSIRNFPDEQSARAWLRERRERPSNAGRKSRPQG
jgi:hypothetical protein